MLHAICKTEHTKTKFCHMMHIIMINTCLTGPVAKTTLFNAIEFLQS